MRVGRAEMLKRLRRICRRMSFQTFENLPHRLGWKHEYWDGIARLRPNSTTVTFELDISPRTVFLRRGVRPVTPDDAAVLSDAFLAAFALAPEYVGYPLQAFRKQAREYMARFFGPQRGEWSPASRLAVIDGRVAAASLLRKTRRRMLLDCVFVRPGFARRGLATALTSEAVNVLHRCGERILRSHVMLANPESLAWHRAFGFRELPDQSVAQGYYNHYAWEYERLQRIGAAEVQVSTARERMEYWWGEVQRIWDLVCNGVPIRSPILDD